MKLYFVRHGESVANLLRKFSNNEYKHPLTEKGIEQAHSVARSLAEAQIEKIYSSPVLRAAQTARILAETLHAPLEINQALREWDVGIYEGTTDPKGWELHSQVQEDWFFRKQYDHKMPGGESFIEIQKRFLPFIEALVSDGQSVHKKIALVSHGGLYMAMLPLIFKNVDFEFATRYGFPYTGCAIAETHPDGLYCVSWCGQTISTPNSHL